MGTTRTLWHVLLAAFLSQRAPRRFEVRTEVPLSTEPLRGDMLPERLRVEGDLCGVLLVPARSPSLVADAAALRLHWRELGDGYSSLNGGGFPLYVVEIDVVAPIDGDDLLSFFGHGAPHTGEARRWLQDQLGARNMEMAITEMDGFDDVNEKLLSIVPPEKRMAGLTLEQMAAGLPVEILRLFSEEAIDKLPEAVRATIRARLGG